METFKTLLSTCVNIFMNGHSFDDWKQYKDYLINNEEEVKGVINTATIPELNRYTRKDKKPYMVNNLYYSLLTTVNLSDSFVHSPMQETYKEAFRRITDKYTEADFLKYKEEKQAKQAAKVKAVTNPETLEEFRAFIMYKGEKAMSEAQRIRYDELTADTRKANQAAQEIKNTEIKKVDGVATEMELKETKHTKKNIFIFVVVLKNRVDRPVYEELNNRAKKLGGYYSTYNKDGAIPGFIFEKKEAALLFMQVKENNVSTEVLKQEQQKERQQTAAESLREKGQKQIEEGEEDLNRDRQANTHRRAAMADHAEKRATHQIEFGKTLVKIAGAMEAGNIKYLDKIRTASDLETLQNVLSRAKYKYCHAENKWTENYELNESAVFYAEMPFPTLNRYSKGDLLKMRDISKGKKLAASRMLNRLPNNEDAIFLCSTPQSIEDYETLFCSLCPVISSWQVKSAKDSLMHIKRLQRMSITDIHTLRAALRELIVLKTGTGINSEQQKALKIKELERKYIGAKIPGFFPTPDDLTNKKIELLELKPGDEVLEPSAGLGHMADKVKDMGHDITCIEIHTGLAEVLREKGHTVINDDFLNHSGSYDKIIMNPPFENLQDIDHVKHAFNLLNSGGTLVATMANNKYRKPEFLEWVNENGWYEENPEGTFKSAFNPTGVSTILVFLTKITPGVKIVNF